MTKTWLLSCAICAVTFSTLAACSSQKVTQERSECDKIANMNEYDNCMRRVNVGQDDAQKARYK